MLTDIFTGGNCTDESYQSLVLSHWQPIMQCIACILIRNFLFLMF